MNPRPLRKVGYFQTKFSLSSFLRRVDKLNRDQRAAIQRVGFGNLLHIPNQLLNKRLLVELMERWDSKKRAFVLPPGEITITTLDVALILGLRDTGNAVILTDNEPSSDLWKDFDDATMPMKISVYFFEERLNVIRGQANEDFVRAFLMFTFVLEDIFHWLSRRKEEGIVYVGGCLILLLVWCYEHIKVGRPKVVAQERQFPRVCQWENTRFYDTWRLYTVKFDAFKENQIICTLQLSEAESKVDIINDLSASTTCPKVVSAAELISAGCPCSTAELISSLRTLGNMFKRRDKNTMEHMKTSSFITCDPVVRCEVTAAASYCIPEINVEPMEPQSSRLHNPVDTNLKIELCSIAENWKKFEEENNFLRKENTDLREEVERLKLEVATLRNERIMLQDDNEKLKKEGEELRRENASNKWASGVPRESTGRRL